ncbi:uncharacterized protein LOC119354910 isoform X3 [Triticum dicoccoides]|uniref:uncharacterized protein LOC119354910 isoform X3 n=1 Tax=Triticum dicoccoides TaxID=85692 RepID=UPI000E792073|nr:uncharacterized protein LOC119354910 isoform X3 [Triticum dicoccoides]
MAPRGDHFDTHVFSSWTCQWEARPSVIWRGPVGSHLFTLPGMVNHCRAQYAHGRFYFISNINRWETLVLDPMTMDFSTVDGPPVDRVCDEDICIVEADEGSLGMFLTYQDYDTSKIIYWQSEGDISGPWREEKRIDVGDMCRVFSSEGRHVFGYDTIACFSLVAKALELERLCYMILDEAYPYSNLPLPYALPTVASGPKETQQTRTIVEEMEDAQEMEDDEYPFQDLAVDFQLLEEENDNDDDFLSEPTVTFELTVEETKKQVAASIGHSNVWNSHPKNYGSGSMPCLWQLTWPDPQVRADVLQAVFPQQRKDIGFIKYR